MSSAAGIGYFVPVGKTLAENCNGMYCGLRGENGWFTVYVSTVHASVAPRMAGKSLDMPGLEVVYVISPKGFVRRQVTNRVGAPFSDQYSGEAARPLTHEHHEFFFRSHGLITFLAAGITIAVLVQPRLRRRYRRRHGLCLECGYDSRGNASDHCPECGTPVAGAEKCQDDLSGRKKGRKGCQEEFCGGFCVVVLVVAGTG